MKYLRKYNEDIDFDDIDDEEYNEPYIPIKKGDKIDKHNDFDIEYYTSRLKGVYKHNHYNNDLVINKVIYVDKEIRYLPDNSFIKKGLIPKGQIIFSLKGHWPWFIYDPKIKIKK
jgi:hypothetical protein